MAVGARWRVVATAATLVAIGLSAALGVGPQAMSARASPRSGGLVARWAVGVMTVVACAGVAPFVDAAIALLSEVVGCGERGVPIGSVVVSTLNVDLTSGSRM
jgi:hypothetical protein